MKSLSIKEIFLNSFKYTISDWVAIVILGIILTFLSILNNFNRDINIIMWVAITILSLIEMGYSFKIIEQTLQGSTKPPIFRNFKELIIHGIKDTIVYAFYFTLMLIVSFLLISMIHSIPESSLIGIILAIIVIGFIFLLLFVSLINLAKHDGKLRYAFHFRELYSLLKRIGIGRIIIVYILAMLIEYLLIKTFITGENIPHMSFVAIIRNLIVTPFLVIFTERTIALSAFNKI
ncbi:DUF4013 domain-containing protein [Methanobrevibacter oralis]|uniref:DUF4013 domain-containing protein n=1 Tax=Methanobrevibacter oralis TaxID=66851 RepID=A0A165ZS59_METOA|nr:DUF4013 domain-containing protein [Methanobrevibacter oralis]KZX11092.1 hypothetical protein MBORA_16610 [Methanobrevibacter oralis]